MEAVGMGLGKLWEIVEPRRPGLLWSMGLWRVGHDLATEQQNPKTCAKGSRPIDCQDRFLVTYNVLCGKKQIK